MRIPTPWDVWLEGHLPGSNAREDYQLQANCYRQGYAAALVSEPVQGLVAAAEEAQVSLGSKALWGRQDAFTFLKTALAAFEKATKKEEAHGS